jgi:hypothetical protein
MCGNGLRRSEEPVGDVTVTVHECDFCGYEEEVRDDERRWIIVTRPSETITATVGAIIGAILSIVGFTNQVEVPAEVAGAIVTLVAFIATAVTTFVANRQRAGDLRSKKDGSVVG